MFSPAHLVNPRPSKADFHVRVQLRTATRLRVPYLRPVVTQTTRLG